MAKLNDAADGIKRFGDAFSGDKISNLVGPLVDFVKQNSGNIGGAISNIDNITGQIASGQGTVGKMIYTDQLYDSALATVSNLQDTAGSARDVLATAKSVISDVAAGKGTVGKLVTDDTLYNSTTASMTNLNQILSQDQPWPGHHRQAGKRPGILHKRQTHDAKGGQGRRQPGRPRDR